MHAKIHGALIMQKNRKTFPIALIAANHGSLTKYVLIADFIQGE
jgi:hypothetical protein